MTRLDALLVRSPPLASLTTRPAHVDSTCPVSSSLCPLSRALFPVSCVLCPVSCVLCPVSRVLCPLYCVLCPVSCVPCPVSRVSWFPQIQKACKAHNITFGLSCPHDQGRACSPYDPDGSFMKNKKVRCNAWSVGTLWP